MKILVGISNGQKNEKIPYQMFIVDVDGMANVKQEWVELNPATLNSCSNVRVNIGKYKSIMQNPAEYLEADFDVNKLINVSTNEPTYQITHVYTDKDKNIILYRTIDTFGKIEMHHISEFEYRKKYCIYGDNINKLPSYVKSLTLKDAYDWWRAKDEAKEKNKSTRFVYESFEATDDMPVQLLYQYLTGVKGFGLGYHTVTDIVNDGLVTEKLHEYFLFKGTANVKLRESVPETEAKKEEIIFLGNKDPYPDTQKLGYYGAVMSLLCDRKDYPVFDVYTRPISEVNYDKDGIEVMFDIIDNGLDIYNKCEEAGCISEKWRIGENYNFFGTTLINLIPKALTDLSIVFQNEKEKNEFGHWSKMNTHDWFEVMSLALSSPCYTAELRMALNDILKDYQSILSLKLTQMIEKISAKDSLAVMKWAKENVEDVLKNISFAKENGALQKLNITSAQMNSLFTFKRNKSDLPDWLGIYSPKTIESLGGEEYLKQFIKARGEEYAELFLSIWAEKLESDQRYAARNQGKKTVELLEK